MSKSVPRVSDAQLAEREPLYSECQVCGEAFETDRPTPFCSPVCGRSQQL